MTIVRERGRVAGGVTIVRGRGGWLGVCDPIVRKEGGLCQICLFFYPKFYAPILTPSPIFL